MQVLEDHRPKKENGIPDILAHIQYDRFNFCMEVKNETHVVSPVFVVRIHRRPERAVVRL